MLVTICTLAYMWHAAKSTGSPASEMQFALYAGVLAIPAGIFGTKSARRHWQHRIPFIRHLVRISGAWSVLLLLFGLLYWSNLILWFLQ